MKLLCPSCKNDTYGVTINEDDTLIGVEDLRLDCDHCGGKYKLYDAYMFSLGFNQK